MYLVLSYQIANVISLCQVAQQAYHTSAISIIVQEKKIVFLLLFYNEFYLSISWKFLSKSHENQWFENGVWPRRPNNNSGSFLLIAKYCSLHQHMHIAQASFTLKTAIVIGMCTIYDMCLLDSSNKRCSFCFVIFRTNLSIYSYVPSS